jgi:hypothetical protein
MTFEIRKILDVGAGHPVVARLGKQISDLLNWAGFEKPKRDAIFSLYIHTLTSRLLRCYASRDEILRLRNESVSAVKNQSNQSMREVPQVVGLQALAEQFLYEAKNYLRDILVLFEIVYGCPLKNASAFADTKDKGDGDFVKWATEKFGTANSFAAMVRVDQRWITEIIRKRNAVEHPGGHSGTLTIQNIRVNNEKEWVGTYIPPTWQRTGRVESDILQDMNCNLDNLLTFAEDVLVEILKREEPTKTIAFYEIPADERDPQCPVRIRVDLSPEMLAKFPRAW